MFRLVILNVIYQRDPGLSKYIGHRVGEIEFVGVTPPSLLQGVEFIKVDDLDLPDLYELRQTYVVRDDHLVPREPEPEGARIAMVGVFDVPCGIATYTKSLIGGMGGRPKDLHIFAEYENDNPDSTWLTHCWNRGKPLTELVSAVKAYDPDVIIIQHEYGNFPNARHWLAFMGALQNYHVIVTLHSVYRHQDKTIIEASCPDIVVHTHGAAQVLADKKINGRVTVIPHGCPPPSTRDKLWNLYGSPHTILQHGFGFPYKGWGDAIRTVAALKPDYPDVFFTGLMSERWPGVHKVYQQKLYELANKLGVQENVGLVLGYQSDNVLDSYMRTNRVALFPYLENGDHTVYGCSGAARAAMAAGLPVVASNVPLFEDLQGVVPRPRDIDGWAGAIDGIFKNGGDIEGQDAFLSSHTWPASAGQYLELIKE